MEPFWTSYQKTTNNIFRRLNGKKKLINRGKQWPRKYNAKMDLCACTSVIHVIAHVCVSQGMIHVIAHVCVSQGMIHVTARVCVIGQMCVCVEAMSLWVSVTLWTGAEWWTLMSTHINFSNTAFISSATLGHWFPISWKQHAGCDSSDKNLSLMKQIN